MICFLAFFHLFLLLTSVKMSKDENNTGTNSGKTTTPNINATTTGTVTSKAAPAVSNKFNSTADDTGNKNPSSNVTTNMFDGVLGIVQDLRVMVAFGIGVTLTAIVWGLTQLCCRRRRRRSCNMSDTLEMVSTTALKVNGQQDTATQAHGGPKCNSDVEYSDIDFSALRKQRAEEEEKPQETAENEYAEIKKEMTEEQGGEEERQGGVGGEQGGESDVKEEV